MAPTNRTTQSQATTQINQLNIIDNNNHDTTSNQPTDTYYTPWGDTIQPEKKHRQPSWPYKILVDGHNGITITKTRPSDSSLMKKIDIFITTKNNVAWHHILVLQQLPERTQGWWEALHLSLGYNKQDQNANPYQPRGVVILSCNKAAHRVAGLGQDTSGLGRFCWTTYRGKDNLILRVIASYRPCKSKNGHLLVLQQQWWYLDQNQPENANHPWKRFWMDLQKVLTEWMEQGDQIIMGVDVNEDIRMEEIMAFFDKFGMANIMLMKHGQEAPATQNRGNYPIDRLFATRALQNHQCGYLSGLDAIGDHRCLWIDIPEERLFSSNLPLLTKPKARRLKMEDPHTIKKYIEYLEMHIMWHNLLEKTKQLTTQLTEASNLTRAIETQLNSIDNFRIQGMLWAEKQCCKLHTRPYGWSPPITYLIQTIKYWWYSDKCAKGLLYHTRILHQLKRALPKVANSELMTPDKISTQLVHYKVKLQQQLGDLNCRQTWLEELMDAQAKERKTIPKKD